MQEKDEYVEQILKDVAALGVKYDKLSYTSDFFPQLADCAERLIKLGHLYADDTPVEQMRLVRPPGHKPVSTALFELHARQSLSLLLTESWLAPVDVEPVFLAIASLHICRALTGLVVFIC